MFRYKLYGKWNECIRLYNEETEEDTIFWKPNARQPHADHMYNMNQFGI